MKKLKKYHKAYLKMLDKKLSEILFKYGQDIFFFTPDTGKTYQSVEVISFNGNSIQITLSED